MPRSAVPWNRKHKLIIKAKDKTNPRYGHKPEERSAEDYIKFGVINLDKPAGPTSHEVAAWVKRIMHLQRVGHGGTLEA